LIDDVGLPLAVAAGTSIVVFLLGLGAYLRQRYSIGRRV
jgi:hypothetical protein